MLFYLWLSDQLLVINNELVPRYQLKEAEISFLLPCFLPQITLTINISFYFPTYFHTYIFLNGRLILELLAMFCNHP